MNRLIINADDFGIHEQVNNGVIQAHRQGILTSTSLLANGTAFTEAVAVAKMCPNLGIGAHLCLVGGLPPVLPVDQVRSLVTEDGTLPADYTVFMKNVYKGKVNFNEVYQELDAQLTRIAATGLSITHVDSHQHMHILPPVLKITVALMKKYGLHRLRIPRESYFFKVASAGMVRIVGRDGLTFLSNRAMKAVRDNQFITTDYFWGMIDGGNMNVKNLSYIIQNLPFGINEIMIHPGVHPEILGKTFTWGYHWQDEYDAVVNPQVRQLIEDRQIELVHYGQLP